MCGDTSTRIKHPIRTGVESRVANGQLGIALKRMGSLGAMEYLDFVPVIPLEPPVNGVAEVQRNLTPSPPERAENEVDCSQSHQHVATEEETIEEEDDEANGDKAENQAGDEREKKEQ